MSLRLLTLLVSIALSGSVFANEEHHPEDAKKPAAEKTAGKPAPTPKMATINDSEKQFQAAREQMKKMLMQMDKIRASKDPQERQRLMQEHMQSMREGAQAMRAGGGMMMMKMMDCPMMSDMGGTQSCPKMGGDTGKMEMGKRMEKMENRMDMMQMMMEQMLERENQKTPMP